MTSTDDQKPYRILALDGGGIRGLYSACILKSLANRYSKNGNSLDIGKGFDLIVGTSTGAILAAGLAKGIPVEEIINLYARQGSKIFRDPTPEKLFSLLRWAFRNRNHSANSDGVLKKSLSEVFGDSTTIEDLWKSRSIGLCIPSVNLSTHRATVFKTPHCKNKNADNARTLVDVCLASSAAPILFPIAKIQDPDNSSRTDSYVDGGLWANNPVIIAIVEALECSGINQPVEIVSLGTSSPVTGKLIAETVRDEGLAYWKVGINPLLASMSAQADGYFHIANFLASGISKIGKSIRILRLNNEKPSAEQAKHLGIDKAYPEAISVLMDLAAEDGRIFNGRINNNEKDYDILNSIFSELPFIEPKEG